MALPYGRAVWGQRKLRRFQFPVVQPCTVPPSLIGLGEAENSIRLNWSATTMSTTAAIKAAIQKLSSTINTLSRFPETDKSATAALLSSTTARAHLRDALEAAALAGAQPDVDQPATTSTPATTTPKCKTADYPFFSCNTRKDKLFSVREGIPLEGALEQASLFLDSAQAITSNADDAVPEMIFGAAYLIELAKAVVDAIVYATHAEEMGGGRP
ncbi:MAG: DUF3077 domain-containing protein [Sulfuricellaceae bacterium]